MKILFIIPGEEEGNSMIFSRRQITFLTGQGVDAKIFFLKSRSNPFILFTEFLRFRKIFHSFQPELMHCHYGTVTALFAAISHRKPLVITYHGSDLNFLNNENFFKELFAKFFSQLAALRASAIICVSEKLKQKLWWRKSIVSVLPMGVDENFFQLMDYTAARKESGIGADEKIILFNYGHAQVKRPDIAEAAFSLVKKKFPESRMLILKGDTTPGKIAVLLNASDCLLLCSDSEGSPTIIKEAMACNLPVVSSDVGDVKQILEQTFPHIITDQNPVNLARGIEEILTLKKRSNGRTILLKLGLTEQSVSLNVLNIYKNILKK